MLKQERRYLNKHAVSPKKTCKVPTINTKSANNNDISNYTNCYTPHYTLPKIFHRIDKLIRPDELITRSDELIIRPDELLIRPNGLLIRPDELIIRPDELIIRPDELIILSLIHI